MANPIPLLICTATFAALGIRDWHCHPYLSPMRVMGIFLGSAFWGPILAGAAVLLNENKSAINRRSLNQAADAPIAGFGLC